MRRRLLIAAGVLAVPAVVVAALAVKAFHYPTVDEPGTADAIVMLAGGGDRIGKVTELVNDGVAPRIAVASAWVESQGVWSARFCNTRDLPFDADVEVLCFQPDPTTTRGEARFAARLAAEQGWDELVVVASTDQITRARLLFDRCFDGEARFVDVAHKQPWPYRVVRETAATSKALLQRDC